MRLRSRLVLSFLYILLVVIFALELPLAITMRRRAQAELEARVLAEVQLVAGRIGAENLGDPKIVAGILDQAASQIGGRLVAVDSGGRVVGDSDGSAATGSDFRTPGRTEIEQALQGRPASLVRHSDDLGIDILAIATPIIDEVQVGALRVTLPMSDVQANLRRTTAGLIALGGAGLAAGLLIALALAAWIARPLTHLATAARRFGEGDYSTRASPGRGPQEIQDVAQAFDDMADQIQASMEAEQEFAHNASHQLRTPLTGMRLRLESAIQAADDPAQRRQLEAAEKEADRLATIVTRLLPGGDDRDVGSSCDLVDVVRGVVERAQPRAEASGSRISLQSPPQLSVAAPAEDVAQMVDNLVDNALMYAPGSILVAISGDDDGCHILVRDRGPGISREDRARVWDRFSRGSAATPGGSGLGLPIVRELAERWGGSAGFTEEREDEQGLSVTIRLPLTGP